MFGKSITLHKADDIGREAGEQSFAPQGRQAT